MAGTERFLQRKLARGFRGQDVPAPAELFADEPQFQGPDVSELLKDAHGGATKQMVGMLTKRGVTSEEMQEARVYLGANPEYALEYRNELITAIDKMKGTPPAEIQEMLQRELQILYSPSADPRELERLQKDGILAPLIVPLQMMQPAVGVDKTRLALSKITDKKVGKVKRGKAGRRAIAWGSSAAITGAGTFFDFTFGKVSIGDLVDVAIEKVGLEKMLQAAGNGTYEAYQYAVRPFVENNGHAMSAIEQLALGKGLLTMTITGGMLAYLFHRKMKVDKVRDLVNFKKHPIHATMTSAALSIFLMSGGAAVDKKITEAPPSAVLAKTIKQNLEGRTVAIAAAVKTVESLHKKMQDPIDAAVLKAYKTGVEATGPLTASAWLALEGNVKDEGGKTIRERFIADMGTGRTLADAKKKAGEAREKAENLRQKAGAMKAGPAKTKAEQAASDAESSAKTAEGAVDSFKSGGTVSPENLARFDAIEKAVNKVNEMDKYKALKMKRGYGAKQLVKLLTDPLPKDAQELRAYFTSMLAIANKKESITLSGAVLGNIKPWTADFWQQSLSFAGLYDLQKNYPPQLVELMRKVAALSVISEYLADVQKELATSAKVSIDLKVQINIPSLGFTEEEILALVIPKQGPDFNFENVLKPSKIDLVWNMIWGTPEAWKTREQIVKRDLVDNEMSENLAPRIAYKSGIYSVFFLLLAGSVWGSAIFRRRMDRIDEENLDKDIERMHAKEDELVVGIMNYAEAFSTDVVANLKREGEMVSSTNLTNDAFKAHIAFVLRRELLQTIPDPRMRGKMLSESPDGVAFMNRTSKRFDENGEYSLQIRNAYERKLGEWMDALKQDMFGTIEDLLTKVDPGFQVTAKALTRFDGTNPGSKEREQAITDLKEVFKTREKGLLSAEAERMAFAIARLNARREVVERMVGDEDDVALVLNGEDSPNTKLTKDNIIASYILADIDAEIQATVAIIDQLKDRGATIKAPDAIQVELTEAEWQKEREVFMKREMANLTQGSAVSGKEEEIVDQLNAYVLAISKGIQPIKTELENYIKTLNPNASLTFVYGYNVARKGPTVTALLSDTRSPDSAPLSIPFSYKIPSAEGKTSSKVLEDTAAWAKPDGILSQRLRVNALFDNNRSEFQDALQKLTATSPSLQFERSTAEQNAELINTLIRTNNIMKAQLPLMEDLIAGKTLSPQELRYFTGPMTNVPGVWKGSFTNSLERAMRARFPNIPGKKIIVVFDTDFMGYIAAVPENSTIPADIASIPDQDKMSILRASRS